MKKSDRQKIFDKYGRLKPIKIVCRVRRYGDICECLCDCGLIKNVSIYLLRSGKVKSCGCLMKDNGKQKSEASALVFEKRVRDIFGNTITVCSNYKNIKTKVVVKCQLGIKYSSVPSDLLKGTKPSLKTAIDKDLAFRIISKAMHGDKYNYDESRYVNTRAVVRIGCNYHGFFTQKPVDHLRGSGCPKCGLQKTVANLTTNHIGWSLNKWMETGIKNNGSPILYVIKIWDKNESFIKIGKSYRKIKERFKSYSWNLPYEFSVVTTIPGSYEYVYKQEKVLLSQFSHLKYRPLKKFHGYNECFKLEILSII